MNIEIHYPELEALIQQRMASGAFGDVEDALLDALKSAPSSQRIDKSLSIGTNQLSTAPPRTTPFENSIESDGTRSDREGFMQMLSSVHGLLTDEEVDTLFQRDPSISRPLDLS